MRGGGWCGANTEPRQTQDAGLTVAKSGLFSAHHDQDEGRWGLSGKLFCFSNIFWPWRVLRNTKYIIEWSISQFPRILFSLLCAIYSILFCSIYSMTFYYFTRTAKPFCYILPVIYFMILKWAETCSLETSPENSLQSCHPYPWRAAGSSITHVAVSTSEPVLNFQWRGQALPALPHLYSTFYFLGAHFLGSTLHRRNPWLIGCCALQFLILTPFDIPYDLVEERFFPSGLASRNPSARLTLLPPPLGLDPDQKAGHVC